MSTVKQVGECQASSPSLPEKSWEPLTLSSEFKNTMKNDDANSTKGIGSPLQTSSPFSSPDFRSSECNGDGDSHSMRTVHSLLLSPIRYTKANQQVTFATFETPSSSPSPHSPADVPTPTTLDSFVTNFEKSSTKPKPSQPYSPEQEFLLTEKVSNMEDSEAKKLLTKVLIDNMGLRQELRTKDKRITAYKGQMLAILDWKARQDVEDEYDENEKHSNTTNVTCSNLNNNPFMMSGGGGSIQMTKGIARHRRHSSVITGIKEEKESDSDTEKNMTPQKTIHSSTEEITVVEETYGVRRSLSIIQELASSIEMDQELLKERLKHGVYLTNQMLVGGIAGWMSALFVKKFGKVALSATGGGIILLVYTARKGFVNVNYDSIYQEISRFCDTVDNQCMVNNGNDMQTTYADYSGVGGVGNANFEGSFDRESRENVNDNDEAENLPTTCSYDKLKQAKNWVSSHTYTMGGFVLSFVYNLV